MLQTMPLSKDLEKLKKLQTEEGITFVHGIGKRKSLLQKKLEQLDECISRLKKYNQYLHIVWNQYLRIEMDMNEYISTYQVWGKPKVKIGL
jgi:hypothetical protein